MSDGLQIRVRGQVQGVGFRPFVWQLAQRFGVSGEVRNDAEGVLVRALGGDLAGFLAALQAESPPLSRIDAVETAPCAFDPPQGFVIAASGAAGAETRVTPDAATCPACLAEILDPADRRHGYAFANCTHCGPRFTILTGLPYDRGQTTMAAFPMCEACAAEYADPADRRFHAQPVACPECGPRLWIEPAAPDPLDPGAQRQQVPDRPDRIAVDRRRARDDAVGLLGQVGEGRGLGGGVIVERDADLRVFRGAPGHRGGHRRWHGRSAGSSG